MHRTIIFLLTIVLGAGCFTAPDQEPLRVAVAASFGEMAEQVASLYHEESGRDVDVLIGATGTHFAQIVAGAPFDVFLAADTLRPAILDSLGLIVPGSRFTYAQGSLALWSKRREDLTTDALRSAPGKRLAMANPRLAPYGRAAQELLNRLGIAREWDDRIVMGESVGQAFQFASTRSVNFGLIAESQARSTSGGFWVIPDSLYSPILQQAVQLTGHPDAAPYLELLGSPAVRALLVENGFRDHEASP